MTGTKKSGISRWGYGWGLGKNKKLHETVEEDDESILKSPLPENNTPVPIPPRTGMSSPRGTLDNLSRSNTQNSRGTTRTGSSQQTKTSEHTYESGGSKTSRSTHKSLGSHGSRSTTGSGRPPVPERPGLSAHDSVSTLVGSKLSNLTSDTVKSRLEREDTGPKLEKLRALMAKDNLDYYIIPSEDAHQSEYTSKSDQRREYMTGFHGTSGIAFVSRTSAYLLADPRYWLQAQNELDSNWHLVRSGSPEGPRDWIEWLLDRARESRIGIDARMISHEKATLLNNKLTQIGSKLVYPQQNLVDLVWTDKPTKSKDVVRMHPIEFTGRDAGSKLREVRAWIESMPPAVPSYHKGAPDANHKHVGTLITNLSCIAYVLNLRGTDIKYNPLFMAYLYIGLDKTVLFVDSAKVPEDVASYLSALGVDRKEYNDIWTWLRKREWGGVGKVLIAPTTTFAISLMLTNLRYTIATNKIEEMMCLKNEIEIEGLRRAYIRDGVSWVKFLASLEHKIVDGNYSVTEYEAKMLHYDIRRKNKHYMGDAYATISATGPNAALPHYTPAKGVKKFIEKETPYLHDSGGQYRDGTCDTTRTVIFGRGTGDMCDAYTRVLQGHIAIDSAIFPEGTSGQQLDVLARRALWKDGRTYLHGTGHGVGSFLTVHEGSHGFSSSLPLMPGYVVTNEPGFYNPGHWGIRIESALVVKRVKTKHEFNGSIWLGFERLTCVPIQTKLVKESMLTKEEKTWIKDHNKRCFEKLSPFLQDDQRALRWLKREAERGIGVVDGPGGLQIDWD